VVLFGGGVYGESYFNDVHIFRVALQPRIQIPPGTPHRWASHLQQRPRRPRAVLRASWTTPACPPRLSTPAGDLATLLREGLLGDCWIEAGQGQSIGGLHRAVLHARCPALRGRLPGARAAEPAAPPAPTAEGAQLQLRAAVAAVLAESPGLGLKKVVAAVHARAPALAATTKDVRQALAAAREAGEAAAPGGGVGIITPASALRMSKAASPLFSLDTQAALMGITDSLALQFAGAKTTKTAIPVAVPAAGPGGARKHGAAVWLGDLFKTAIDCVDGEEVEGGRFVRRWPSALRMFVAYLYTVGQPVALPGGEVPQAFFTVNLQSGTLVWTRRALHSQKSRFSTRVGQCVARRWLGLRCDYGPTGLWAGIGLAVHAGQPEHYHERPP
jgi:hypothetical protein